MAAPPFIHSRNQNRRPNPSPRRWAQSPRPGDVGAATAFIADQREKAAAARQQRRKQRAWLKERAQYGNTAAGRYVDGEKLEGLCQLGCDKALAAEALRQNENDGAMALDVLLDTVKRSALALAIVARDMAQHAPQAQSPSAAAAGGEGGDGGGAGGASTSAAAAAEAAATSAGSRGTAGGYEDSQMTTEVAAAGSSLGHQGAEEQQNTAPDSNDEVEADVAAHVREDPMAAYDIDVEEEGDIITTYMALLASSADVGPGSSCAVASGSGGQ